MASTWWTCEASALRGVAFLLSVLACISASACGGSTGGTDGGAGGVSGGGGTNGGGSSSSGLPRAATLMSLTSAQVATLCDWQSTKQGGYGRSVDCPDGSTQTTDADKDKCVSGAPVVGGLCPTLTVGDIEDCAKATLVDLCAFTTAVGCANLRACLGS